MFKPKAKRKSSPGILRSNPSSVVTALLFSNDNCLFSAGANDGCVKQWDLRMLGSNSKFNSINCLKRLEYCGTSFKAEGFTSLALDTKNRIYASCSDSVVYSYDYKTSTGKKESDYVKCFQGSRINNYTKISVLDDDLLVCGSQNSSACVWSIQDSQLGKLNPPIYTLRHGTEEVSAVTCDPLTYNIYSCDDDITISKWKLRSNNHLKNQFNRQSTVISEYECRPETKSICLQSQKSVVSPKTPPLTSLKSWLSGSNKQNTMVKSPPKCSSISFDNIQLDSPKISPHSSPTKRKSSSDSGLNSSKKQRVANDENKNCNNLPIVRGKKNLFNISRR